MGCIVNGPGEMADADYGYVGAGRDKVSLYKGKECIEKNIPEEMAIENWIASSKPTAIGAILPKCRLLQTWKPKTIFTEN